MQENERTIDEETIVCMECGCPDVERAYWRTINEDEFVDTVDDLEDYCPGCEDDCSCVTWGEFEDSTYEKWRSTVVKLGFKEEITKELALEANKLFLAGLDECEALQRVLEIKAPDNSVTPQDYLTKLEREYCTLVRWQLLSKHLNGDVIASDRVISDAIRRYKTRFAAQLPNVHKSKIEIQHDMVSCLSEAVEEDRLLFELPDKIGELVEKPKLVYGLHPSEVKWESLADTKSRGFPIGERTEVPPRIIGADFKWEIPPHKWTRSDLLGSQAALTCDLNGFLYPNFVRTHCPTHQMVPKVEQLVSPCHLTRWIRKANSTVLDRDD